MFKELFQKLKDSLGGGAGDVQQAPVVNERMARITAGETFTGPKRRLQNLTGGSKSLTPEQVRAIRHEAKRQRQEREAAVAVGKVRARLGKARLERLAHLPKVLSPTALEELRKQHPQLTDADLAPLAELFPLLDRDVLDDLARLSSWGADETARLLAATPEPQRVRLAQPAAAILERLPQLLREGLLRIDRQPAPKSLEVALLEYRTLLPRPAMLDAANGLALLAAADVPKLVADPPSKAAKVAKAKAAVKKP